MTATEAVKKVVELANSEVGYSAESGKRTKYAAYMDSIKDYYNGPKNGFDWCDVFVDYLFYKCFGDIGRQMIYQPTKSLGAGVGYSANYYKAAGAFKKIPEIGSQVFFGSQHTGIVTDIVGNHITTVEGNTGGGAGRVMRKNYLKTDKSITGYGIPNWALAKNIKNEVSQNDKTTLQKKIEKVSSELSKKAYDTIQGKYGNGAARVKALGSYYTPVQWLVNEVLKE